MTAKHEPNDITRAQVKSLAEFLPQKYIARHMGMSENTLRKYYRSELDSGMLEKDIQLARTLHEMACYDKNASVAIFLAKTRLGMVEPKADAKDDVEESSEALSITFDVAEAVGDIRVTKGK